MMKVWKFYRVLEMRSLDYLEVQNIHDAKKSFAHAFVNLRATKTSNTAQYPSKSLTSRNGLSVVFFSEQKLRELM